MANHEWLSMWTMKPWKKRGDIINELFRQRPLLYFNFIVCQVDTWTNQSDCFGCFQSLLDNDTSYFTSQKSWTCEAACMSSLQKIPFQLTWKVPLGQVCEFNQVAVLGSPDIHFLLSLSYFYFSLLSSYSPYWLIYRRVTPTPCFFVFRLVHISSLMQVTPYLLPSCVSFRINVYCEDT